MSVQTYILTGYFCSLCFSSFSHIRWLLPESLVINKVVPVTQKECVLRYPICTSAYLTVVFPSGFVCPLSLGDWATFHSGSSWPSSSLLGLGLHAASELESFLLIQVPLFLNALYKRSSFSFFPLRRKAYLACISQAKKKNQKTSYLVFCLSTVIPKKLVFQGFRFLILLSWVIRKVKAFSLYVLLLTLNCFAIPLQKVSRCFDRYLCVLFWKSLAN